MADAHYSAGCASAGSMLGWLVGLAYYNWLASHPPHVSVGAHLILATIGTFAASIFIAGTMTLLAACIAKLVTGRAEGSSVLFMCAVLISPVIAFLAADYALRLSS
jgi:hypothetical protein